jgi:lysophospholipase L1-like esterase
MPALRKVAARLLLLALSIGVSLLAAEIAVRIARPQPVMLVSQGLYEPDPPLRYRLKPGFRGTITNRIEFDHPVAINGQGLRGPEVVPKPEGMFRVLALGDSFTFGVGAEEDQTYPALLEEILARAGRPSHVLNGGAPGYGVPDAVAWYERHGKAFDADVVLLGVFVGNDLQDAAPSAPRVAAVDGYLVQEGEKARGLARWLYYNSHLYVLLKTSPLGDRLRALTGRGEPRDEREIRTELALYGRELPDLAREGAEATERAVAKLAEGAGDKKILALLIPSLLQVDPARWKAALDRLHLDPASYDPNRPNVVFQEIFGRHGIPVLDLTEPFAKAIAQGKRIYYPIDQHLMPEGYLLVAEEAAVFVTERVP